MRRTFVAGLVFGLALAALISCKLGEDSSSYVEYEREVGTADGEPIKELRRRDIEFIGPKTGQRDTDFQNALIRVFREDEVMAVRKAFLLRTVYGEESGERVVLALVGKSRVETVTKCAEILAEISGGHPPLDVIFLNDEMLREATSVAKPFYDSDTFAP